MSISDVQTYESLYSEASAMGVGTGDRGALSPLDFENFSKKGCFLSVECEKTNFSTFGPPKKIF